MTWLKHKSARKEIFSSLKKNRWSQDTHHKTPWITSQQILSILGFLIFASVIAIICFAGQAPSGLHVLPGQIAQTRVITEIPFSYESKIERKKRIEELAQKVPPSYQLTLEPYQAFRTRILTFNQGLNHYEQKNQSFDLLEHFNELESFVQTFNNQNNTNILIEDAQNLLTMTSSARYHILAECLLYVRDQLTAGIIEPQDLQTHEKNITFVSIHISGQKNITHVQSQEEAYLNFKRYLKILELDASISSTLFRIFKDILKPNLIFDATERQTKIQKLAASIPPIIIHVEAGTILTEPNQFITQTQYEKIIAYAQALKTHTDSYHGLSTELFDNLLLILILLLEGIIYIHFSVKNTYKTSKSLSLCALILVINLLFIRFLFYLGNNIFTVDTLGLGALLPYLAPVALGPILISIMLDGTSALLIAFLASTLTTLMHGHNLETCLVYMISNFIGIVIASKARARSRVVKAGALAGITAALSAAALGLDEVPITVLIEQIGIALATGIITGIIVLGLIPLFEHLFKITTDITLLELTDFNHPLLRRLQLIAPGTYHHSLMVANLAEKAANEIHANALTCRAAALFHDIGKMIKPEYFIENQKEGTNPHVHHSPSMSALVIKHHVKEGVEIAKDARLPKVIIDIIEQHHGTTLIHYFYNKALQKTQPTADQHPSEIIDETTYRYDGPKPTFKESAIIFFADSIEAASRSLKKVTPQHIEDLIEKIFNDRLQQEQLDDCPLNFQELNQLKKSFTSSLINMFHSRIEYPDHFKE